MGHLVHLPAGMTEADLGAPSPALLEQIALAAHIWSAQAIDLFKVDLSSRYRPTRVRFVYASEEQAQRHAGVLRGVHA